MPGSWAATRSAASGSLTATTRGLQGRACSTSRSTDEPPAARPMTSKRSGSAVIDVDGLGADRAGTAQNHDPTHAGPTSRSRPTMAAYPARPGWLLCEGTVSTRRGNDAGDRVAGVARRAVGDGRNPHRLLRAVARPHRAQRPAARRRGDARRLPRLPVRPRRRGPPRGWRRAGLPQPARPAVQPVPVGPVHRRRAVHGAGARPPLHPRRPGLPLVAPRRPAPQPDQRTGDDPARPRDHRSPRRPRSRLARSG